jgi:hypothetical protein
VVTVERTAEGDCRVVENTTIGTMMKQTTRVLVAGCDHITEVKQTGSSRGQEMNTDLRYAGGRVKGIAITPGPNGPATQLVDTEVPANVVDVNMLQTILSQLPWTDKSDWTLPLFSSSKNEVSHMEVKVVAVEEIKTVRGTAAAYKVELGGNVVTATVWVSQAAPHRVLKLVPKGGPMEMILADARAVLKSYKSLAMDLIRIVLHAV